MAAITVLIKAASKKLGQDRVPLTRLTYTMMKQDKKAPKLRIKASEARNLLPCCRLILEEHFPPQNEHEALRLRATQQIDDFYKSLKSWTDANPNNVEAARLGRQYLITYCQLTEEAIRINGSSFMWRLYPKCHQLLHCIENQVAVCGSPATNHCYADESSIGDAVKLAEALHPVALHRSVVERYRL